MRNATTVAQIEVFPALVDASITPSGPLCAGETITLSAATGMASYEWGPNMEITSSIQVSQPGTYTLTASDSTGCEASDTLIINTIVVSPSISLVGDTTFCEGDSVQLVAAPGLTNYSWQPGNDTTLTLQVFSSGTYFVSAQDTNGCVGISNSITLNTAPTTIDVALLGDTTFCDDDTVFLQAQTPGLVSYTWSPGSLSGQTVAVTQAGTYVVTTTDVFGCEAISDPITVFTEQNNTITPTTSPDQLICQGAPTQITASTTGPGTLTWYLLNSSLPLGTGPVYTPSSTATTQTYVVYAEEGVCQSAGNPVTVEVY
ncbi:MAG: hypothetical protein AAGB22_15870, partial [Bacteroidota bacterium]